jgi:DNA primase
MKFSQEFIEKVRDANNIVDLIGHHTQLKPTSGGFMGRCPFPDHQEKTGSFSVSEAKQVYYCFGCGKRGNIFRFIQDFMGLGFPDAVEFLAGRANIALPENNKDSEAQDQQARRKKEIIRACTLAADFFREQFKKLPKDHPAKHYAVEKRGLSPETLEAFQIGYAPEAWDELVQYLVSKNVSMSVAEEARLIKARKEGTGFFDVFRDRLMFPITNTMGEVIAFGGRIILQGEPKYLNSADTPAFTKGKVLYGYSVTAKYIRAEEQVIVVEGYMDLVSLYQSGIQNVVATMGTALTPEHAKMFQRLTKNIAVLFDGDQAGQSAAERSLPILLTQALHPKGLILPEGQDPDDFVRAQGADSLKQLLAQAPDLFTMILGMWTSHWGPAGTRKAIDASEKIKICDQLKPVFASMQDARIADLYITESAKKLEVPESWMKEAVGLAVAKPAPVVRKVAENSKSSTSTNFQKPPSPAVTVPSPASSAPEDNQIVKLFGAPKAELLLASLGIKNTNNFDMISGSSVMNEITHPGIQWVLQKAALTYRQEPEKFDKLAGLLTSFVDKPELLFAYQEWDVIESKDLDSTTDAKAQSAREAETRMLQDCMKRIRDNYLKSLADQLTCEVRVSPTPEKLEQLMTIQRERRALSIT